MSEIESISKKVAVIEEKLGDKGRVFVRCSGTEPLARITIEGSDEGEIHRLRRGDRRRYRERAWISWCS